jgi:hypothetical protein
MPEAIQCPLFFFMARLCDGGGPLIAFDEIRAVTAATFAAIASIRNRMPVRIV